VMCCDVLCCSTSSNWQMPSCTATARKWFTETSSRRIYCSDLREIWKLLTSAGPSTHHRQGNASHSVMISMGSYSKN